jgi:hypothetical protein
MRIASLPSNKKSICSNPYHTFFDIFLSPLGLSGVNTPAAFLSFDARVKYIIAHFGVLFKTRGENLMKHSLCEYEAEALRLL